MMHMRDARCLLDLGPGVLKVGCLVARLSRIHFRQQSSGHRAWSGTFTSWSAS